VTASNLREVLKFKASEDRLLWQC